MAQGVPGEIAHQPFLGLAQRCWPKAVAVAAPSDSFGTPPLGQHEGGQHPVSRPGFDAMFSNPPVERPAVAQHTIDMVGDVSAVLGADIAPAPEVIGCNLVGRTIAGIDRSKNVDRGGGLRTWGQLYSSPPLARPRKRGCRLALGREQGAAASASGP